MRIKGITLISLIITIIILLILAGITIAVLTGENGLIVKINQAKDKYSISEAKEKIEVEIAGLRIEKEGKGEELTKEDLPKLNNDEIDVRSVETFPVKIIFNKYIFNIDENFNVTYVEETDGTVVTYITEPEGYTNKDEVKILIKVNNLKGIKTIEYPDGDKLICNGKQDVGIDYKVTANGIYTFKVIDNENKEVIKDVVIEQIDKVAPISPKITIENIKDTSFEIVVDVQDGEKTETSVKSGIKRYEYYIGNKVYVSTESNYVVTELNRDTNYEVYVKVYDNAGNASELSNKDNVKTTKGEYQILTLNGFTGDINNLAIDALDTKIYDKDFESFEEIGNEEKSEKRVQYFKVDPECWGKYLTIYYTNKNEYGCVGFGEEKNNWTIGENYNYIRVWTGIPNSELCARSIIIPDSTNWIRISLGTSSKRTGFKVYEIWCSEEDLSRNVYTNDNSPF